MTIDREKLVDLLVEKTGFSREQVESQLSELVNRIQAAAGEGKSFEIEGFGTFSMADGGLNFEPAEELKTEINNDYAGMEPIELIGANRQEAKSEAADGDDDVEHEASEADDEQDDDPFAGLEDIMGGEEEAAEPAPFDLDDDPAADEEEPVPESGTPEAEGAGSASEEELEDIDSDLDEILGLGEGPPASSSILGEELSKARSEKSKEKDEETPRPEDEEQELESESLSEPAAEVGEEKKEELVGGVEGDSEEKETEPAPVDLDDDPVAKEEEEPEPEPEDEPVEKEDRVIPVKTKWEPAPELKGIKKTSPKKKETDTIGSVLIVAMIVIVIGVGGWFAYDMGLFSRILGFGSTNPPQQQVVQQSPPPVQQQPESDGTSAPAEEPAGQSTETTSQPTTNQSEEPVSEPSEGNEVAGVGAGQAPPAGSVYGLMGTVNQGANNGYTIVVHSMRSRVAAEAAESTLAGEGYRTLLIGTTVNGIRYWRVGVGQFETVSRAQAAAGRLSEPYRSEFFIRRIGN